MQLGIELILRQPWKKLLLAFALMVNDIYVYVYLSTADRESLTGNGQLMALCKGKKLVILHGREIKIHLF